MSNKKGSATAMATITSTAVFLCQGQYQLDYSIKMTNGSYPILLMKTVKTSQCVDASFGRDWAKAGFFMVASNRSQI